MAASSRWFVGSSSSNTSGVESNSQARDSRERCPPDRAPVGRSRPTPPRPSPPRVTSMRVSTSHAPIRSAVSRAAAYAVAAPSSSGARARASAARSTTDAASRTVRTADSTAWATVSCGAKGGSWCSRPTRSESSGPTARTSPVSGACRPAMMRSKVLLPEPFSPIRPVGSPAVTEKLMSVSTRWEP